MDFLCHRMYRGPLRAVIFDWAGTTVDYGSFAPTAVFLRLFERYGVTITTAQARSGMGLMKKDHLRTILSHPDVVQAWHSVYGRPFDAQDVEKMFADFVPLQMECLTEYAEPIPGCLETVQDIRARGMKIGSTTGYIRAMMDILIPASRARGYEPDGCVCPDDVPSGRPLPWMCYQNAIQLQTYPLEAIVKVGDTLVDIEEGLNAGMWTIGLALTGNLMGMSVAEVQALSQDDVQDRSAEISLLLYQAGAHYVVDSIADVPAILDDIQLHLRAGERP